MSHRSSTSPAVWDRTRWDRMQATALVLLIAGGAYAPLLLALSTFVRVSW